MSSFLTTEMADKGIDMVTPSIEGVLTNTAKRFAGHLRVSVRFKDGWQTIAARDFGDTREWKHDYEGHAAAKELISQRTGEWTRHVQDLYPELLEPGDTVYYGSVVNEGHTIVVAFSGVEAYFDEMIAHWVLVAIQGLLDHAFAAQRSAGMEFYQ